MSKAMGKVTSLNFHKSCFGFNISHDIICCSTYCSASSTLTCLSFSRSVLFPAIHRQISFPNIFRNSFTQLLTYHKMFCYTKVTIFTFPKISAMINKRKILKFISGSNCSCGGCSECHLIWYIKTRTKWVQYRAKEYHHQICKLSGCFL